MHHNHSEDRPHHTSSLRQTAQDSISSRVIGITMLVLFGSALAGCFVLLALASAWLQAHR